jgi:hypothetical protein
MWTILWLLPVVLLSLAACQGSGEGAPGSGADSREVPGALVIAYAADSADTFPALGSDSIFVIDWLRRATDSAGIALGTKEYAMGTLVMAIGTHQNGDGGYWLYKVNGAMVPKSVADCRVAATDSVLLFFDRR